MTESMVEKMRKVAHQGRILSAADVSPASRWDLYYPLDRTKIFFVPLNGLKRESEDERNRTR